MSRSDAPSADQLETFANSNPGRDYAIEIVCVGGHRFLRAAERAAA